MPKSYLKVPSYFFLLSFILFFWPLVMPAEFPQLKDLECYIKFPGILPCTRIQMKYKKASSFKKKAFCLNFEEQRAYNLQVATTQEVKKESHL